MKRHHLLLAAAVASLLICSPVFAQSLSYTELRSEELPAEAEALAAATRDLCGRTIVLLGENGFHGDGRTAAFKADLVQRLVDSCDFNAVAFEASRYDFIALSRAIRRGDAEPAMLPSAIGGLWNQNEELQPLLPFLFERASAGKVSLIGMDDQLGSRGAFYSLEQMPAELAGFLREPVRQDCAQRLRQRIWSAYTAADPYAEGVRDRMYVCLAEIGAALVSANLDYASMVEYRSLITALVRALDRDFLEARERIWARDEAMARNLISTIDNLPAGSKVIVWSANSHVAKDASATELYASNLTFGQHIQRTYGAEAFALGFTAAGGAYRYTVRTEREIPDAQPDSLEALALADQGVDVAYLGPTGLRPLSAIPGSAFDDHKPVTATWAGVYDGVVVFRTERPPRRLDE